MSAIIYVDTSAVREGKHEELKQAIINLVDFVQAKESRPIGYNFYISQDHTQLSLVQIHPDSSSLEFHMQIASSLFPGFNELILFKRIDVYGNVSDTLLKLLQRKAQMLGGGAIVLHELQSGFTRFGNER